MATNDLLTDPVFHLNLLLWMAKEQPRKNWRVRPILHELGYKIQAIDEPFRFPEELASELENSTLDVGIAPKPDVVLQNNQTGSALYFEAKASSFSIESSCCRQARSHLLACGDRVFPEVRSPLKRALLCYLIGSKEGPPKMRICLEQLAKSLADAGFEPGPYSAHGLELIDADVVYNWDATFSSFTSVEGDSIVVLRGVDEETDPSPLFLICSADDYADPQKQEFLRSVLVAKVHRHMLCCLHQLSPGGISMSFDAREVFEEISEGLAEFLGRDSFRASVRLIRKNIFCRINDFWSKKDGETSPLTSYQDSILRVQFTDTTRKEEFMHWFEDAGRTNFKTAYVPEPPEDKQLLLFSLD